MEAQHTPGPWKAIPEGQSFMIQDENGLYVAATYGFGAPDREGQEDANAALIAAAPELLAALERLERFADQAGRKWGEGHAISQARLAIAKAKGGAA